MQQFFRFPGTQTEVINAGSYNYLGFAQSEGPCAEDATYAIKQNGLYTGGTTHEIGFVITII
jgi:serine palmitoyltransferase